MIRNSPPAQPIPFIGRKSELADITSRLLDRDCRLLTVTGLGGSGKSRLAIEAAGALVRDFPHGVVFVDLQPVARSEMLVTAIAQAVGLTFYGSDAPEAQLLNFLREKTILLLLDNFEHLLPGATVVSRILSHTPDTKILVTSREALHLSEEWVYPLQGLSTPPSVYSISLENYEAVQLFFYHARRVQPNFNEAESHESVVRICRMTEGLPLAIELVATWLRGISVTRIAVEMHQSLDFLSTRARNVEERHRSMRAVFDQSWKFMSENERLPFARLSVFRGGFDSKAAEQVAGATLSMLSILGEKSLLRADAAGRFDMHELARQYGEEQLTQLGLSGASREAHAEYYMGFLNRLSPELKTTRQRNALNEIDINLENVLEAWEWAVHTGQTHYLAAAADSLFTLYELQSRLHEGDELLEATLKAMPDAPFLRALLLARRASIKIALGQYDLSDKLLNESTMLAQQAGTSEQLAYILNQKARAICYLGEYREAERLCYESLALYEELSDEWGRARCLHVLGFIFSRTGKIKAAQEHYRQAVTLFRTLGDSHFLNGSLINLGVMNATLSENIEARLNLEESLDIATRNGNRLEIARALDHLGMLSVWGLQDYPGADVYYERSLSLRREIGDLPGVANTLNNIADIAVKVNDFARAQQLYEEALALFQRHGDPWNTALTLAGMGDAAVGLERYDAALEYLRSSLQKAYGLGAKLLGLNVFYSVVILLTKMGKTELAAALTGVIVYHPDSPPGLKDMTHTFFVENGGKKAPALITSLDDVAKMGALVNRNLETLAQTLLLPPTYLRELVSSFAPDSPQMSESLTSREREILQFMAAGLTNPQIAEALTIGTGTVKTHTLSIYRKLDVANRTQAIVRAQELGLLRT